MATSIINTIQTAFILLITAWMFASEVTFCDAQIDEEDVQKAKTLPPVEVWRLDNCAKSPWMRRGIFESKMTPPEDRLYFLEVFFNDRESSSLESGPHIQNGLWAEDYFVPQLKQLNKISLEIKERKKQGLSKTEREALIEDVMRRFREIMPERSVEVFFQREFLTEGPFLYFSRSDIREEFGITDGDLQNLEKIARKHFEKFNAQYDPMKTELFIAPWKELSGAQRQRAEELFGLRAEKIGSMFLNLEQHSNSHFARQSYESILGPALPDYKINPSSYSEIHIGVILDLFLDRGDKKIYDKPLLADIKTTPYKHTDTARAIEIDRVKNPTEMSVKGGGAIRILQNLKHVLNESEQPLSEEQEQAFHVMIHGTDEFDGLGLVGYNGRRIRRKVGPFAETLTAVQRQISREVILMQFGPTRLLLNEPLITELELSDEQRLAIFKASLKGWETYTEELLRTKQEAYQELLQGLTKKQQQQFTSHVGDSLKTLSQRMSRIEDWGFRFDFDAKLRLKRAQEK